MTTARVVVHLKRGEVAAHATLLRQLVDIQYERNDVDLKRGNFRVRGDTLEIHPGRRGERLPHRVLRRRDRAHRRDRPAHRRDPERPPELDIFPAKHFITPQEKLQGRARRHRAGAGGAPRATSRRTTSCWRRSASSSAPATTWRCCAKSAIAPASRTTRATLDQRAPGAPPAHAARLLPGRLPAVHRRESHMTMPQIGGMYNGDRARKDDAGRLRLPPALGAGQPPAQASTSSSSACSQAIYVSATPGPYELEHADAGGRSRSSARPAWSTRSRRAARPRARSTTWSARSATRVGRGERVLVTTLTKRMAEDLADYLHELGIKVHYLHSRDRDARAHRDPARPAPGRLRRGGRHQPAARRPGPARSFAGGHPGRRQGRLPALGRPR